MTLVFTLLQKDFLLFAADRRHTRGDPSANYRYDCDTKVHEIMGGSGLFGFAGDDLCEQIFLRAKRLGIFSDSDLQSTAERVGELARAEYMAATAGNPDDGPPVDFLMASFTGSGDSGVATSCRLSSPGFYPMLTPFPVQKFEVIGRSRHGALYCLHRFGNREITYEQAMRLAAFTMAEIYECDTSVGGLPMLWVLRREQNAEPVEPTRVEDLMRWARETGESFGRVLLD